MPGSSAFANAATGRRTWSLTRDATSPTTPSCQFIVEQTVGVGEFRRRHWHHAEVLDVLLSRLGFHARLQLAPLNIQAIKLRRGRTRRFSVGREQAVNAELHVLQASGGIESRRNRETQVRCLRVVNLAAGDGKQRLDAGPGTAGTHAREPLSDEHAVL